MIQSAYLQISGRLPNYLLWLWFRPSGAGGIYLFTTVAIFTDHFPAVDNPIMGSTWTFSALPAIGFNKLSALGYLHRTILHRTISHPHLLNAPIGLPLGDIQAYPRGSNDSWFIQLSGWNAGNRYGHIL